MTKTDGIFTNLPQPYRGYGTMPLKVDAIRPFYLLPHWRHHVRLHHGGAGGSRVLKMTANLIDARMRTL